MWVDRLFFYGTIAILAGAALAMLPGPRATLRWRLIVAVIMTGLIFLLRANPIDVTHWAGRGAYGAIAVVSLCVVMAGLALAGGPLSRLWFGLAAFLLVIESGFRAVPIYDTLAANPGIQYFWPDWVSYPLNNFGHRDRQFVSPKPDGTYRVLLLGDSYTEGAGLSRDQTFGRLLEKSRGAGFEAYNLGHAGFNTREEADLLLKDGPRLQPDLLILNYVFNDAETHPHQKAYQDLPGWYVSAQRQLNQRFGSYAAYGVLTYIIAPLLPKNFESGSAFLSAYHRDVTGKGWSDVKTAMADISNWAAARGVPVIGVIWPFFEDRWSVFSSELHGQVGEEMRRHGFDVVDLGPILARQAPKLSDFAISPYDQHPNAEANKVVAAVLAERIRLIQTEGVRASPPSMAK